jgi:hypothetical protein
MSKEMVHINEQQVDLDMEAEEFPILDELKTYIKPYEELWALFHEYKEKFDEAWQKGLLEELVPDEVESDHKRMMSVANKLSNRFETLKCPKP